MVMQLELDPSTINKFYDQHNELFNALKPLQKVIYIYIYIWYFSFGLY